MNIPRVEKLEWKEPGGIWAAGHLVYPANFDESKRYPLVIVQYRSHGFLRGGVGDEYPIFPLASNGFFVLSFDRPERYEYFQTIADPWLLEGTYWGQGLWERESALSSIREIVKRLINRDLIDPTKIGITGLSDGAETVWYSLIHSDIFSAAAASSGGWSPSWYWLATRQTREHYMKQAAGLPSPASGDLQRWRRISPEFHADSINTPVLIQVADRELVETVPTISALEEAGQPVEAYVFPNEYHIKWQPKHKLAVYNRTIDWFNFWLRDVEDSDSKKAAQYERWRRMKDLEQ